MPVVLHQLQQHVLRADALGMAVLQPLVAGDVADRAKSRPPDLARPFRDGVGHGEDLVGLLVQQQVVVPEMRSTHVPVEVLRLEVEREDVGEELTQNV